MLEAEERNTTLSILRPETDELIIRRKNPNEDVLSYAWKKSLAHKKSRARSKSLYKYPLEMKYFAREN